MMGEKWIVQTWWQGKWSEGVIFCSERKAESLAGELRWYGWKVRILNLCPPSPEEAKVAFDNAPEVPLSEERIQEIVRIMTGQQELKDSD